MDLDHVALATADAAAPLATLVGELGATVLSGGQFPGFRPVQVRVGDAERGMTVELLEPWDAAERDFLLRFLARHGDGPHHLTFTVDDFDAALDAVRATGRTLIGVDRSEPSWMEAFLLPAEAFGTVVQLAAPDSTPAFATHFAEVLRHGPLADPAWWPALPPAPPTGAVLRRVVLRTGDRAEAVRFFGEVLGGRPDRTAPASTELTWPGGARLLLEDGDGRPGIVRLEVEGPAPTRVVAGTRIVGS